jgi:iron complex outermembrane receptor protein
MKVLPVFALILLPLPLMAQWMTDSIHPIEGVEIRAERIFVQEEAGTRQTIIDTVVLEEKASVSLSELLSENTSVFIKSNGRGAMATASFRGTAASHTRVSWNGLTLNSPMLGMVDFSLIPVYLIDELKLKHGSASVSEGGGGIGGSIHLENTPRWKDPFELRFIQGLGSYGTFDEYLQFGLGGKKIRSSTRLYHNQSRNDYTFVNRGIAIIDPESGEVHHPLDTNANADYQRYGLMQEIYYRPAAAHMLSLVYWGQLADRAIPWPTSYEGPDNANLNQQEHADHQVVLRWNWYASIGKLAWRTGYASRNMDYLQWKQVPGLGSITDIASFSHQQSLQNRLTYEKDLPGGFSLEGKADLDRHLVATRDTVTGVGYDGGRTELSLFTALRKSVGERLNLNLMLRQEWMDGKRAPLIPFAGLDLKVLDSELLILKASISRNYHHPTLNDLYWQPGGNPGLLPEEGFSLEGGLEYQKEIRGHLLESSLSIYRSDIRNWIIWIPSSRMHLEPMNVRRVLSYGVEFDLRVQGTLGPLDYRLAGTYAYTPSKNLGDPLVWGDASQGKQLPYVPLHSGNFLLGLEWGRFFTAYQYNAYGERFTTSSNDPGRLGWLYPYFMNDLSAGARFRVAALSFTVELKVYNLFNESYHSVLYRPMPGRNYLLVFKIDL